MLPGAMQTTAQGVALRPFYAVELVLPASPSLPAKTIQLLDGAGVVSWGGVTWKGADPNFGSWAGFDKIEEGIGSQSSLTTLTFLTLTDAAVQQLGQPASQMAPITIYLGHLDPVLGTPVCDPVVWRYGLLNTAKRNAGMNVSNCTVEMVGYMEYFFNGTSGAKLNSSFHQTFFPNENGFAFVDNVQHQIPWGASGPRPDQVTDTRNYDTDPGGATPSLKF